MNQLYFEKNRKFGIYKNFNVWRGQDIAVNNFNSLDGKTQGVIKLIRLTRKRKKSEKPL